MPFTIGPKPHNIIPRELKVLIEHFFSLEKWEGLYLTGGTCLAEYYFGHRLSEDIDLFTQDKTLFKEAQRVFKDAERFPDGTLSEIRTTSYICQYNYLPNLQSNPIKIDLILDTTHRIGQPLLLHHVWVDNLDDVLSNKIGCLISRNEVKDYLDLFYLIPASHLTTKEIIDLGLVKEGGLDPLILANQMEFIQKAKEPPLNFLGQTNWNELQLFFKKIQKECLDLIRP